MAWPGILTDADPAIAKMERLTSSLPELANPEANAISYFHPAGTWHIACSLRLAGSGQGEERWQRKSKY
jgi:hypothetical protein